MTLSSEEHQLKAVIETYFASPAGHQEHAGSAILVGPSRRQLLRDNLLMLDDGSIPVVRYDCRFQEPVPYEGIIVLDGMERLAGKAPLLYSLLNQPKSFVVGLMNVGRKGAQAFLDSLEKRIKSRHSQLILECHPPENNKKNASLTPLQKELTRIDPSIDLGFLGVLCLEDDGSYETECKQLASSLTVHEMLVLWCWRAKWTAAECPQDYSCSVYALYGEYRRLLEVKGNVTSDGLTNALGTLPISLFCLAMERLVSKGWLVHNTLANKSVNDDCKFGDEPVFQYRKFSMNGRVSPGQVSDILLAATQLPPDAVNCVPAALTRLFTSSAA